MQGVQTTTGRDEEAIQHAGVRQCQRYPLRLYSPHVCFGSWESAGRETTTTDNDIHNCWPLAAIVFIVITWWLFGREGHGLGTVTVG